MKVVMKIEGKLENVFFEILRESYEYYKKEHTEGLGISSFNVSLSRFSFSFYLVSSCINNHRFTLCFSQIESLSYQFTGSRYGFIFGYYPTTILSKYFRINPSKIILQKYRKQQTINFKNFKEKAEEITEEIKQNNAYLEVKLKNKKYLARITEYETRAPKEWNLNPLEYVVYDEKDKPIGAIPMAVVKQPYPVDIEQLNKKQKQYIRFFD